MSKDTHRRFVDEPTTRFSDAISVFVVIVMFIGLTLTVGVIYQNYASSDDSDAVSHRASTSISEAGSASVANQMARSGSASAPTGAAFIYLIGGMSP